MSYTYSELQNAAVKAARRLCTQPETLMQPPVYEGVARHQGCTCTWWGRGAIVGFDSDCPVIHLHRGAPVSEANPKAARAVADGKAPLDYLEPVADEEIAWVLHAGAAKYGRRNFADPDTEMLLSTYVGAIKRHILALQRGEMIDPDDGRHHLAHIGADVHVVLAAIEAGTLRDDCRDTRVTQLSNRVHKDGDQQAKALTAAESYGRPMHVEGKES